MDQLIESLVSDRNAQVMDTGYVLNLMHHTKLPYVYETEQVARIFSTSGATIVVESQLSVPVEEYWMLLAMNMPKQNSWLKLIISITYYWRWKTLKPYSLPAKLPPTKSVIQQFHKIS
jgi:hypothetical protein